MTFNYLKQFAENLVTKKRLESYKNEKQSKYVIKILILSVLLYFVFRMVARFLTFPARMNQERENPRVFVYRDVTQNQKNTPKEKDISDKGRVVGD